MRTLNRPSTAVPAVSCLRLKPFVICSLLAVVCSFLQGCGGVTQPSAHSSSSSQASGVVSITPASIRLQAGATQQFTPTVTGVTSTRLQWSVNGVPGGTSIFGTITPQALYTAPAIDPGASVVITASVSANPYIHGNASVAIANPPLPPLQGVSYSALRSSWDAVMLPWIADLSGLNWNPNSLAWTPVSGWTAPANGIGPNVYYLEQALRPATQMAIAKQDFAFMEELASFHLALLQLRSTTIGQMLQSAPANAVIFIDGKPTDRTFAWYEPYGSSNVRIRECQQCNAQYLSTTTRLIRGIAEMPAVNRTPPLMNFVRTFSGFVVSEQLLRMLYGSTHWAYYDNQNIPQPVVSAWQFLSVTRYEPPDPYKYEAAMTDMELWMIADAADLMQASLAAPELSVVDDGSKGLLAQAVLNGTGLMQARCHHTTALDGADVLSAFAGDYDDHSDYAFTSYSGPSVPTVPQQQRGLSWDVEHSYRLPIIFRTLYETRDATGAQFPALQDLVALGNTYVHLAFDGDWKMPDFNNFLDGNNGWFRVGYPSIPNGYPPHQYCNSILSPNNCLTAGTVQGWGQLAFANPSLAALYQALVDLAADDSPATATFKDEHYYYHGHYSLNGTHYPWLMVYVAGDSAERVPVP